MTWNYVDPGVGFDAAGQANRADDKTKDNLRYTWGLGVGYSKMSRDPSRPRGLGGMNDADADTRGEIATLALQAQTETHAGPEDHLTSYINSLGDLWGFFESEYSGSLTSSAGSAKYGGTSDDWLGIDFPVFNAATAGDAASTDAITVSHTVQATYGNRIVVAWAYLNSSTPTNPDTVTYAGQAMTELGEQTATGNNISLWYRVAPTTGANDCVATWPSSEANLFLAVHDFYFVDQSTPFGAVAKSSATATSMSDAVTTTRGSLSIGGIGHATAEAVAVGAGQTEMTDNSNANANLQTSRERDVDTSTDMTGSWDTSSVHTSIAAALLSDGAITWANDTTAGVRMFNAIEHKGKMLVVGTKGQSNEGDYEWYSSTDGKAWAIGAGTGWPTTDFVTTTLSRRNNFDDRLAYILDENTRAVVALYEDPDSSGGSISQHRIYHTTDAGANWTNTVNVPGSMTPHVLLLRWQDPYSTTREFIPVLITNTAVSKIDVTNSTADLIYRLPGAAADGLAAAVWVADGRLYISQENGNILALGVDTTTGGITFENINPPNGFVTTRQGHANFIYGDDPDHLYIGYGGHASSKNASIWAIAAKRVWDGSKMVHPWHSFYKDATQDQDLHRIIISAEDDANTRVHVASEGATSDTLVMFEEPQVTDPGQVTRNYEANGFIEFPDDDMGDPHEDTAVYQGIVNADDLSATSTTSDDFMEWFHGADGAAWTNSDNGNFESDNLSLQLGSGVGASMKRIRNRLEFEQNTAGGPDRTKTPKLNDFEIEARKKLIGKRVADVEIDLELTHQETGVKPKDALANLETIVQSVVLVPLSYGDQSDIQVEVSRPRAWKLRAVDSGDGYGEGHLTGTVPIRLSQAI